MKPLYNFETVISDLDNHDWVAEPFVCLVGPVASGKSRLVAEYVRRVSSQSDRVVVFIDARSMNDEISIARAAVRDTRRLDMLRRTESILTAATGKIVIQSTIVLNGEMNLNTGAANAILSVLLDEITSTQHPLLVIVDHDQQDVGAVTQLVTGLAAHLLTSYSSQLRMFTVHTLAEPHISPTTLARGSHEPAVFRMHPLDPSQVLDWSQTLGIPIANEGAEMIHTLTGGWSGDIYVMLGKLSISETFMQRRYAP